MGARLHIHESRATLCIDLQKYKNKGLNVIPLQLYFYLKTFFVRIVFKQYLNNF